MRSSSGFFITLEGIDGSGKTTQALLLKENLEQSQSREVILVREPGGTKLAEQIREILLHNKPSGIAQVLLFYTARMSLLAEVILPKLQSGAIVICDRFVDSTVVYQSILGGLGHENLHAINAITIGNITPDLTILLNIPPKIALDRLRLRNNSKTDDFDIREEQYIINLSAAYQKVAEENKYRIVQINADDSAEAVLQNVLMLVKNHI